MRYINVCEHYSIIVGKCKIGVRGREGERWAVESWELGVVEKMEIGQGIDDNRKGGAEGDGFRGEFGRRFNEIYYIE